MTRIATVLAALIFAGTGCVAFDRGSAQSVELAVSAGGTCTLHNRVLRFEDVPRALKTAGASGQTLINVKVPDDIPTETLRALSSRLMSAGYRRVVFSKPKHAAAGVKGN